MINYEEDDKKAAQNGNSANCETCNELETHQQQEDKESIVSDRCWEAHHRTDSHKWLMRDGFSDRKCGNVSTMKESYQTTKSQSSHLTGRRTQMLLDKMLQESKVEAHEECRDKPHIEEYITTYDDTHCKIGFEPKPMPRDRNLYVDYPLYANQGLSYWHFQHVKFVGDRRSIPGATKSSDVNHPFRKNSNFSKPLEDTTDGTQQDR